MIERHLRQQLERIARRIACQRMFWRLSLCWLGGAACTAALSWIVLRNSLLTAAAEAAVVIASGTLTLVLFATAQAWRRRADELSTARAIEQAFPDLDDRLLAAAEQRPDAAGRLSYLQREVVRDVLVHSRRHDWRRVVPARRMLAAFAVQCVCLAAFVAATIGLAFRDLAATGGAAHTGNDHPAAAFDDYGLSVEPGHTEIERGTSLLVLARFERTLPGSVNLIVTEPVRRGPLVRRGGLVRRGSPDPVETLDRRSPRVPDGASNPPLQNEEETFGRPGGVVGRPRHNTGPRHNTKTIALAKSLDDPLFGGRIPEVASDLTYRLEYDGRRSPEFSVTVFEYPRLERADATIIAPPYAGREPVTVPDARRVSILEGSQVVLICHANKPLAAAELTEAESTFALHSADESETAWTVTLQPAESKRYRLKLVDGEGRTNKLPPEFVIDVIPNRPPELKLTFPGKDRRVSPLEELALEATAWDDIGLVRYGLVYSHDGSEATVVLGEGAPRQQDARLAHHVAFEDLGAEPDELLSYYFFADDHGPDGTIRRTCGDMFFAEVRPFEEIFREGQQPPGGGGAPAGGPQGQKIEQLAELQKQIAGATWTIIRRETSTAVSESFTKDVAAIAESQQAAVEQLTELRQNLNDARSQRFADDAEGHMQRAAERLHDAAGSTAADPLAAALSAEQAAYQALLRLRAREHQVVRGQGGGGGGGGGSPSQQQLDQLELTSKQNRYQTGQQAQSQPPSLDREQLQVLNRLRELARRQSGVNQQLKELELALQNARTDSEREEIQRRLKRLRDEQQRVLRDLDEVRDRLDRPENQQRMSDTRQQIDQTRQQVREASEALRDGQVSQAINSGTRAERELENLRDDFRRRTAHQFADAMNDLRERAGELSNRQQQLGESLEDLNTRSRRSLRDAEERRDISRELTDQKDRLADVLDGMRQVIEQAEHSEPLLSKQLYDTVRQTRADAPEKSLDAASQLTDRGLLTDARTASDQARRGIDALRDRVQKAADAVLGNELDSLKRARNDLRDLTQDLDRELAQAKAGHTGSPTAGPEQTADASPVRVPSDGRNSGKPSGGTGQQPTDPSESQQQASRADDSPPQGPDQAPETSAQQQQASPGDQPPNESPSPGSSQPGDNRPSSSGSPSGQGSQNNSAQGDSGESGDGQSGGQSAGDNTSPRGPGRQQRPSLLSSGGQSGGPGEGPGGRAGPLTGDRFQQWSDRLRDVEESVGDPERRNEASRIRERARSMRAEFKRHSQEPNWDLVRAEILEPMYELEARLAEEIARRESKDALVPIDRDPVPARFAEAVREYYERLGDGQRR